MRRGVFVRRATLSLALRQLEPEIQHRGDERSDGHAKVNDFGGDPRRVFGSGIQRLSLAIHGWALLRHKLYRLAEWLSIEKSIKV